MDVLKIATINAAQFPWPLGLDERDKRLGKLIDILIGLNTDVVCLQEMWSLKRCRRLRESLKIMYPYSFIDERWGRYLIGLASGLMILSKHPIERKILKSYKMYRGDEHLAKKGCMGVEIKLGDKGISVFTTHLQAGPGIWLWKLFDWMKPPTNIISEIQCDEMYSHIIEFNLKYPLVITGDFNVDANESPNDEYMRCMRALRHPRDTYIGERNGTTWKNGNESMSRIDYILCDYGILGHSTIRRDVGPEVSDHLLVSADLNIDTYVDEDVNPYA